MADGIQIINLHIGGIMAARLLGATEAWRMEWQLTRSPREHREREKAIDYVRQVLGEEAFAAVWE
jgi:hypothetical protein